MLVPAKRNDWEYHRFIRFAVTISCVQYLDPLYCLPYILVTRAYITNYTCTKRARNIHPKFQSTPSKRKKVLEQRLPAHTRLGNDDGALLRLIFEMIVLHSHTCYDSSHSSISIQDVGTSSYYKERPA